MDTYIERREGKKVKEIFAEGGEEGFRAIETDVLRELGAKPDPLLISCGGGIVKRPENLRALHQNGVIFWLRRDLDKLERDGRPLSRAGNLNAMYEMREKRYLRFADYIIDNNRALEDTVEDIRKVIL